MAYVRCDVELSLLLWHYGIRQMRCCIEFIVVAYVRCDVELSLLLWHMLDAMLN